MEQLGSEKIETRLGGIYTLERISRESPSDYWTIMETLTAFVRERTRWKRPDASTSETMAGLYEDKASTATEYNNEPPTDIAAVLRVIVGRDDKNRDREKANGWYFDLRGSDLRGAFLRKAHLEGAFLTEAHLEQADFRVAHFEGAFLSEAHLEGAVRLLRDQFADVQGDAQTILPQAETRKQRPDPAAKRGSADP